MVKTGKIYRVAGPVVVAELEAGMYDVCKVGKERLLGEVIQLNGNKCTIQVYEDTTGIRPGEDVENTGQPLTVELGPGLLSSIYDGIQRPLQVLRGLTGDFIGRGATAPGLDRKRKWDFKPILKPGAVVKGGDVIGTVKESETVMHKILVPPYVSGKVTSISGGSFTVTDTVGKLDNGTELKLMQIWPARKPRPVREKLMPIVPLITGQRIFDSLFPLAKGGVAAIPGPFGSGKCVTGDTKIFANGELVTIAELYEKNKSDGDVIESSEQEILIRVNSPIDIQTFNGKEITQAKATHVYKGKTSALVEITTRSGRKIRLTPIHKLFKVDEKLNIVETEAVNLKESDYILSPRRIEVKTSYHRLKVEFEARVADEAVIEAIPKAIDTYCSANSITKKKMAGKLGVPYHTLLNFYRKANKPTLLFVRRLAALAGCDFAIKRLKPERDSKIITLPEKVDEEFAELLGYLMSDGMIKGEINIHFFNEKEELRNRVSYLLKKLFGLETKEYYANTVWAVTTTSTVLAKLLNSYGYPLRKKSRNVKIPDELLSSPESVIKSFLTAYISCDGHVSKTDIEVTTASKEMQIGLSYLLLRLGVLFKAAERIIKGRTYYRIFISPREAIKIHPYYDKKFYYNATDIVPMTSGLFKQLLGEVKPFVLEKEGIETAGYYVNQNLTVKTFVKIQSKLNLQQLSNFAASLEHVFCDKVKEVKVIKEAADVYDITVPGTHNFVGGDIPMILHNTVSQQQLAKWCDADVIVYVGCGERGNEMTEVLTEFPELIDPKTGKPLMQRTILIANTSNMPVAAREASVYTGITLAEYYRDMGYSVALMADSTSRWAEAMREISSRLEEMPGEEGYPAYLASRISEFYERAGRATTLMGAEGSVSVIGAVSPPGGDFSEPVTQNTLRVIKTFWALDAKLAQRRHFPSINWLTSYSLYLDSLAEWYEEKVAPDWTEHIIRTRSILQEEEKLMEILQLVGSDALPEKEQVTLLVARMFREFLLQQNAFHPVDTYSEPKKTYLIMKTILHFADLAKAALDSGIRAQRIVAIKSKDKVGDVKFEKGYEEFLAEVNKEIEKEFTQLK